uniref:Uncharacterized protein n=1 Tax=virus sp. ctx9V1 TaxID=2828001 RepID=A0A8S5RDK6_9VIRU|nr:MAG TPA: hypothetical protein [virus sp. ctx9V1]
MSYIFIYDGVFETIWSYVSNRSYNLCIASSLLSVLSAIS